MRRGLRGTAPRPVVPHRPYPRNSPAPTRREGQASRSSPPPPPDPAPVRRTPTHARRLRRNPKPHSARIPTHWRSCGRPLRNRRPSWLRRRPTVAGVVIRHQGQAAPAGVPHPRLKQQAGIGRAQLRQDHPVAGSGDLDSQTAPVLAVSDEKVGTERPPADRAPKRVRHDVGRLPPLCGPPIWGWSITDGDGGLSASRSRTLEEHWRRADTRAGYALVAIAVRPCGSGTVEPPGAGRESAVEAPHTSASRRSLRPTKLKTCRSRCPVPSALRSSWT